MIVDDSIANYKRFQIRDINSIIRNMSPEQKQHALIRIQDTAVVSSFLGQSYNKRTFRHITTLLSKR